MLSVKKYQRQKINTLLAISLSLVILFATLAPAIANILMILVLILFISLSQVRDKCLVLFKTKLGYFILAWLACLIFFALITQSSYASALKDLSSWRKFLLFPIALVVFNANYNMQRFCLVLLAYLFTVVSVLSFVVFNFPDLPIKTNGEGIMMQHHVTQTLAFSVAALVLLTFTYVDRQTISLPRLILNIVCLLLLLGNVFYISTEPKWLYCYIYHVFGDITCSHTTV